MLNILFLCFAGFVAALVNSIAGGGGIISVPAFILAGLSPHYTLGTNKFSSTTASFTSSIKFARSGKINKKLILILSPFTLIGAVIGVKTVLSVDQKILSSLVMFLLIIVSIYTFFSKNIGSNNNFKGFFPLNIVLGCLLAFSLGFYDGFFGPGTGSFLIFGFLQIFKFDFINAAGNAKFLNFVSNITSVVVFALNKKILILYGIPTAIFMILGAQIGTKLAMSKGAKLIKPIFILMTLAVAIKMIIQLF